MYLFRCYIAGSSRGIASLGKSTRSARRNRKVARTRNWTRESKTTQIQNRKVRFSWFVFIRFENWHVHLNVNDNLGFHQLSCSLRFQGKYSEWIYLNIWYDTCWYCSSGIWIGVLQTPIQRREVYAYKVGSSGNRSTEHRGLHPGDGRTHLGHLLPQRSG